jgi:hypothetical protein
MRLASNIIVLFLIKTQDERIGYLLDDTTLNVDVRFKGLVIVDYTTTLDQYALHTTTVMMSD